MAHPAGNSLLLLSRVGAISFLDLQIVVADHFLCLVVEMMVLLVYVHHKTAFHACSHKGHFVLSNLYLGL